MRTAQTSRRARRLPPVGRRTSLWGRSARQQTERGDGSLPVVPSTVLLSPRLRRLDQALIRLGDLILGHVTADNQSRPADGDRTTGKTG